MQVFISYASEDRARVQELASRLEEAGHTVWDPEAQVLPGDNYGNQVGAALEESNALVVLLSPEAVRSREVRHEINYALGSLNYANRLVPVLVRPTDDIPWILRQMQIIPMGKDPKEAIQKVIDRLQDRPE